MSTTVTKVALIGANGKLGPAILHAILSSGEYQVTVISRASSTSTYPDTVHVACVSDNLPDSELLQVLSGVDALIIVFAGSNSDLQIRLADVSVRAGVKRIIPADFGSCDSSSERAIDLVPLYAQKKQVREHLEKLAESNGLTWTSLVNGHFFDYGLTSGLLQFNLETCKALIFDDGDIKWSTTTLATIGKAVVRLLQNQKETENRMLYIQSFCISQNELLNSVERAMNCKWQVEHVKSSDFIKRTKAKLDQDVEDADAFEDLVSVVGIIDANWENKKDFANGLLGLEREDLDNVIDEIIKQ